MSRSFDVVADGGALSLNGAHVANFSLSNPRAFYRPDSPDDPCLLRIDVHHMNRVRTVDLDLSDPLLVQLHQQVPTCRLLRETFRGPVEDLFISLLGKAVQGERRYYFSKNGLHRLPNGAWVYICGKDTLGQIDAADCAIAPGVARAKLVWDPTLPPAEATANLCGYLASQREVLLPIWGYTLISSLRSLLGEIGLSTFPALYLLGRQGWGKTTVLRRFVLINDDTEIPGRQWASLDASSTPASIMESASSFRDQVVLVDDLAKSCDGAVMKQRLGVVANVLRFASNESTRSKVGPGGRIENCRCQAGVAFTGEIPLSSASDITRVILVELTEPMSGGARTDRVMAATVFRHFMKWLLPHLEAEKDVLMQKLSERSDEPHARLKTTKLLLQWGLDLYYRFAVDAGAVTSAYQRNAMAAVERVLTDMVFRQAAMADKLEKPVARGNLSFYIQLGYQAGWFHIVKRKHIAAQRDCVLEKDALCIRTGTLLAFLQSETPYIELTEKQMTQRLCEEQLLSSHSEKRAASKKIHGKRYLEINFVALREAAVRY